MGAFALARTALLRCDGEQAAAVPQIPLTTCCHVALGVPDEHIQARHPDDTRLRASLLAPRRLDRRTTCVSASLRRNWSKWRRKLDRMQRDLPCIEDLQVQAGQRCPG